PRNGFSDPGPNVGLYSSITIGEDGRARISYYDDDNKDLKYAEKQGDGSWAVHVVDSNGDVGAFSQLRYLAGRLRLVYFVKLGAKDAPQFMTTLRYAEAKVASPRGPSDWTFRDVVPQDGQRNPCGNTCQTGDACVFLADNTRACASRDKDTDGMM